jgi:hypothetical protein
LLYSWFFLLLDFESQVFFGLSSEVRCESGVEKRGARVVELEPDGALIAPAVAATR